MSKPKLSEALCTKIEGIVESYVKNFPDEWKNFRKQQAFKRSQGNAWAEVNGYQGVVIRALIDIPETLWGLIKIGLSDAEYLEFNEEKYKLWFGNRFPDTRWMEGRL